MANNKINVQIIDGLEDTLDEVVNELNNKINTVSSNLTASLNNKIIVVKAVPDPAQANVLYGIPE